MNEILHCSCSHYFLIVSFPPFFAVCRYFRSFALTSRNESKRISRLLRRIPLPYYLILRALFFPIFRLFLLDSFGVASWYVSKIKKLYNFIPTLSSFRVFSEICSYLPVSEHEMMNPTRGKKRCLHIVWHYQPIFNYLVIQAKILS